MKILHVLECFDMASGGPPPVVTGMCEELSKRGHDVSLYTTRSSNPFKLPQDVRAYCLRLFDVDFSPYGLSWSMMKALRSDIPNFDLVHIHMMFRFPQAIAAHFARRNDIPHCIQPHGSLVAHVYSRSERRLFRHLYGNMIEKRSVRRATAMIFTAPNERKNAQAVGFTPRRSFIVPVGASVSELTGPGDPADFRRRYNLNGKELLLWMGRLTEKKALDVVVAAFGRIAQARPNAILVLAGPDSQGYGVKVRQWIAEAGVDGRVIFTGMILDEEKRSAFRAADVFVFPSYAENFGVVILEAMAAGAPLVISPGIDIWEEIEATGSAVVVDSDPIKVADATITLLENPARRANMARAGREGVYRFDWSQVGVELEDAYRAMLAHE
jgi:glycosyltransferase involved in cell wall biosynthesis